MRFIKRQLYDRHYLVEDENGVVVAEIAIFSYPYPREEAYIFETGNIYSEFGTVVFKWI